MNTRLMTAVCVLVIGSLSVTSRAAENTPTAGAVVLDVAVARPLCLAATIVGSAFFIVSLPVTAIAKSVKPAADALVVKPARATFTRPVGDFEAIKE